VLALRGEADVGHDRDTGLHHGADCGCVVRAAFDLDGVGQAFLEEADTGGDGLLRGDLVAAEGQVGHHQGPFGGPGDGAAQGEQLVHGDRQAGLVAEHVVGGGISHQEHLDAGGVENLGRVLLVGRQHRELRAVLLGLLQVVDAHLARLRS
jgi:hypothetical protein